MSTKTASDATTDAIAAALLERSRVINQGRVHDTLCRQAGVELDRSGAMLLYKLSSEGDHVRITDLADRLEIDAPAVTRKVQQLERAGLTSRTPDPDDARACRLALTPNGRRTIERLLRARREWLAELLGGWSGQDREEFARLLQLFAATIAQHGEGRRGC